MIDITNKKSTSREAKAQTKIFVGQSIIKKIKNNQIPKGDCLNSAKIAAFMAVKNTPNLIPMCHPVRISFMGIEYKLNKTFIEITCIVKGIDKTGFEMEALVGASVCALTIYDMCKMFDKSMVITETRLIKKSGGKRGNYER